MLHENTKGIGGRDHAGPLDPEGAGNGGADGGCRVQGKLSKSRCRQGRIPGLHGHGCRGADCPGGANRRHVYMWLGHARADDAKRCFASRSAWNIPRGRSTGDQQRKDESVFPGAWNLHCPLSVEAKPGDRIEPFTGAYGTIGAMILRFSSMDEMLDKMDHMHHWVRVNTY